MSPTCQADVLVESLIGFGIDPFLTHRQIVALETEKRAISTGNLMYALFGK